MNKKAIIFDFDDTIIDTFNYVFGFHKQYAKSFGFGAPTKKKLKSVWGKSASDIIASIWLQADHNHYWDVASYFREFSRAKARPHDGALETIKSLKTSGFFLGIVTHSRRVWLEGRLKELGIFDYFDYLQTEEDTEFFKPDPRVFDPLLKFLSAKNISKDEIVYIGDSIVDYLAAKGTGIKFFAVLTGPNTEKDFLAHEISRTSLLKSLRDLKQRVLI